MEYEGSNEYKCKSTLGFEITTRWMKMTMMMKIDAKASKIQAAAVMDSLCKFPSISLSELS
jgi:hypothetical protein